MKTRLLYIVCLLIAGLMSVHDGDGQITTMFPDANKIQSDGETAALYSVKIYSDVIYVTVELVPTRNKKRMDYWSSVNTFIEAENLRLPIMGFLRTVDGKEVISTEPFSGNWGWNNVKVGEKYRYTMVFKGTIPPGCTKISIKDYGIRKQYIDINGAWKYYDSYGYGFSNYTINNPPVGGTSWTEQSVKKFADENNDGFCGIYEASDADGYKLGCVKQNGEYILVYLGSKSKMTWWRMGDKKATLRLSATTGFFKAAWVMKDKSINSDFYVVFDGGSMRVVDDSGETFYLKMYPTANSSSSQSGNWSGSGFALNQGYVCTNYHVVEGAKTIKIYGVNGNFTKGYSATVVASDKVNDLAILQLSYYSSFGTLPYGVKTTVDEVGEGVFVLGYPLTATMGNEVKLTTGVISSKTGFQGDVSLYQISAPVQPGNSGGPVFNSKGNLIGIVNAKHRGAENVSYAIKASYLQNLVNSSLSSDVLPKNTTISSLSLSDKVSKVKNFVLYIECSSDCAASSNSQSTNTPPANFSGSSSGGKGSGGLVTNSTTTPAVKSSGSTTSKPNEEIDVKDPYVKTSSKGFTVKRVRVTSTQTIVDFEYDHSVGRYGNVNPTAFIKTSNGTICTMTDSEGVPITSKTIKQKSNSGNGIIQFTLIFSAIPKSTTEFDLIDTKVWDKYNSFADKRQRGYNRLVNMNFTDTDLKWYKNKTNEKLDEMLKNSSFAFCGIKLK